MEFVKKTLAQIREHLASLNARDRLLFVLILALMGGAFFWLIQANASPELVPLVDQDLSAQELAALQNQLEAWNEMHSVQDNRILVRRQDVTRLLARLSQANVLPKDMRESWRKYVEDSGNMWLTAEDRQRRWQLALQQRLAGVIGMMDDVADAQVFINQGSRQLLSDGPRSDPSASVYLKMRGNAGPDKKLVCAVADLVCGSVDRLTRDRVNIVANGAPYHSGDDTVFSGEQLDRRREYEQHFVANIERALGIPGVLVAVYVELESQQVNTEEQKFGEPVVSSEQKKERSRVNSESTGEPGVRPNVGAAVTAPGTAGEKSEETEKKTEFGGERDKTTQIRKTLPDEVKHVRATINVPHTYLLRYYKERTGKEEKPTPEQLEPVIATRLGDVKRTVLPAINAADPGDVEVSWYYDEPVPAAAVALAGSGMVGEGSALAYAKPVGLGVLALGTLGVVLVMLRKASSGVNVPGLEPNAVNREAPPSLDADTGPVGEAGQTEGVLQGVEVDEETLRVRNMADQVATLVKEDPDAATGLVKQWIMQDR